MTLRFHRLLWTSALLASAVPTTAQVISLRPNATWTERAAAGDLQRVIHAATGRLPPIRPATARDKEAVCVGFGPGAVVHLSLRALGDQGFVLKTVRSGGKTRLVAAGATPVATSYACYTLAEHFGAGFYLGGDVLPTAFRPGSGHASAEFRLPNLNLVKKPAFEIRGVLPWYNFFDSPTAWNAEDYRFFIDQLAKSKNNFLGFHSYDAEPFCAYRNREGKLTAGSPLNSTAQPTWGTVPMKTSEFAFGTDRYFAKEYFGADCSIGYKSPEEGIDCAKKLLADALWYAEARGVKTCVGFEVTGDPTAPGALDELELRLKQLLKDYPMLDYVWIWESEGLGANGSTVHPVRSDFGAYYRRWQGYFKEIEDRRRKSEAVRIAIYASAARRILKREAPHVRMVLSGWGGDRWLHFTDFYPGLDKILPKDVIFAALDNIAVTDTVSDAYGKLSRDRDYWPIPWFEYDGDQWLPQPNTKRFFNAARDSLSKGAKGLLAIHWRTRDVEESHAYISQFAWNTNLGYEEFYRGYAKKSLGDERAAKLLMALQDLGYRWIGGSGQPECGGFAWGPAADGGVQKLDQAFELAEGLPSNERLDYLRLTREWAVEFSRAARLLHAGGEVETLLSRLKAERRSPTEDERRLLTAQVDAATEALGKGVCAYSRRVSNRGELGTLATINAKAWASLRDVRKAVEEIISPSPLPSPAGGEGDSGPPAVSSILRLTTAFASRPFRMSAVVYAAGDATARVVYRSAGGKWVGAPLRFANRGRLEGTIPASAIKGQMIEYYIEVTDGSHRARWPLGAPNESERLTAVPAPRPAPVPTWGLREVVAATSVARVTTGPGLVQIDWDDVPATRFYVQKRASEESIWSDPVVTRDTWFEDRSVRGGATYEYAITDADTGRKVARSNKITIPEPAIPTPPEIRATPGPARVRLAWKDDRIDVGGYAVYRADSPDGPFTSVEAPQTDVPGFGGHSVAVSAEPGKRGYYQIRARSLSGKQSPPSNTVECTALPADALPVAALRFDGTDRIEVPGRVVEDGIPAMRTGPDSFVALPHSEDYNPSDELTVEFWVKLVSRGVMPVFVCHGVWDSDGYFVQCAGGGIRFFLGGVGTLDAGSLQTGRWTHVAVTYDGAQMTIYIDGTMAGAREAFGPIGPAARKLYVGRYEFAGKEYDVDGFIAAFRLYPYALTPAQIIEHYGEIAGRITRR